MFQAVEKAYGEVSDAEIQRMGVTSSLRARSVLRALRDRANTPRRQLETADRKAALKLMRLHTPINRLISRRRCCGGTSRKERSLRPSPIGRWPKRSLRRALSEYVEHYHAERNHQGKDNVLLFPRDTDIRREQPVQCRERLGGLLRYYHQEAA
jgi:hypothetical protein